MEKLKKYKLSFEEAGEIIALFLEDTVLTDEKKDICISIVNRAARVPDDAESKYFFKFQGLLYPEHYFPASSWDCLKDPRELISTKIHLLAAQLINLKVDKPSERTFSGLIALLIGAQPSLDAVAMSAAHSSQALDLVNQLKEQHSIPAKSEREASTRSEPELIWIYPSTIEEFQERHPNLYSSVFRREPPVANRVDPIKLAQLKAAVPSRASKGSVKEPNRSEGFGE